MPFGRHEAAAAAFQGNIGQRLIVGQEFYAGQSPNMGLFPLMQSFRPEFAAPNAAFSAVLRGEPESWRGDSAASATA